ncbi:MAG TPA: hypothetical protein VFE05_12940 [Longimicrobiaceae bacterium]|jgi:hypothetical protein|nr:hypothetical protein [Longimicrobiaceae bacterium]
MPRVQRLAAAVLCLCASACQGRARNDVIRFSGTFQPGGACSAQLHGKVEREVRGSARGTRMITIAEHGPEGSYVIGCEGDRTSISFFVEVGDTAGALRSGTYRIAPQETGDSVWVRRGWAGFQSDVQAPDGDASRRYGADTGTLTITRVGPQPDAPPGLRAYRVLLEGSFDVSAHGYWHFE